MDELVTSIETNIDEFVRKATLDLHEAYIIGEKLAKAKTYEEVDNDKDLAQWEKSLIKLLIFLKPAFDMLLSYYPALKSLIDWAIDIYNKFASQGRLPATT